MADQTSLRPNHVFAIPSQRFLIRYLPIIPRVLPLIRSARLLDLDHHVRLRRRALGLLRWAGKAAQNIVVDRALLHAKLIVGLRFALLCPLRKRQVVVAARAFLQPIVVEAPLASLRPITLDAVVAPVALGCRTHQADKCHDDCSSYELPHILIST